MLRSMARTSKPTASSLAQADQAASTPDDALPPDEALGAQEGGGAPAAPPSDPLAHAQALVEAARRALVAAPVTRESLPRFHQLREEVLALLGALDGIANQGKHVLAKDATALIILEPKQFSVPQRGNIMHAAGYRVDRAQRPEQFDAIVAQLQYGTHFTFA